MLRPRRSIKRHHVLGLSAVLLQSLCKTKWLLKLGWGWHYFCSNVKIAKSLLSCQADSALFIMHGICKCYGLYTFWNVTSLSCFPSSLDMTPILAHIHLSKENSYSISHLLGRVTTQWLDSDDVVTVVNCQQHGDYSHPAAGS